jgi:HEAT repeat protein
LNVIYEIITSYPDVDYSHLFDEKLIEAMMQLTTMCDISCKLKAIEILGFSKNEKVVPVLIDLIKADGIDARKSIVNSIVKIDPQDLSSLKQFLEDNNATFEQKCTALDCIGRSSCKDRFDIIKTFLCSKDETLPRITLDAIHNDFKPVPLKEISALLTSKIPEIRVSAADAMGRLKNKEFINKLVNQLADEVPEVQEAVDDALIKIGEIHEIPLLAPYLNSFSKSERKTAFEYFGIHHPDKINDKFLDGLQDPSVEIRVISLKVIANQKLANLELIRKGIADPVDAVQVQAIRTIQSLPKDKSTLSLVKELLESSSSERLKVELIQVLSGLEEFNVVDSVLPLLEDESSWVRLETVEFLKYRGDSSVIKHLEKLLNSDDDELVEVVEEAIDYLE